MTVLYLAIEMAILMFIGFIARKKRIVDERFTTSLAAFIFNFVFPCMVVDALQTDYKPGEILNSGFLLGISVFSILLMFGVGFLVNKIMRKDDDLARMLLINLMFTNFTYMAFPVMSVLYGDVGKFYIAVYTIPVRVLFYVLTPLILTLGKDKSLKLSAGQIGIAALKSFLSPPVLAVPVGLALYFSGLTLPVPIDAVIHSLAQVASPMGMVLCGVSIAAIPLSRIRKEHRVFLLAGLRLVLAPALGVAIYLLAARFFTIDPIVAKVSILYLALPAAATTTVMAVKAQSDATRAAQCVFVTTVFSVITLPVWSGILDMLVR